MEMFELMNAAKETIVTGTLNVENKTSSASLSSATVKMDSWIAEEGLKSRDMLSLSGGGNILYGTPIGDDTNAVLKMLTPVEKANGDTFKPFLSISSEMNIGFYDKSNINYNRATVDTGTGRDYTSSTCPEFIIAFKPKTNSSSADMHTISGTYYTSENVTLIYMANRCHSSYGYYRAAIRIKRDSIEVCLSNTEDGAGNAGYNMLVTMNVYNTENNALVKRISYGDNSTILPTNSSSSLLTFKLGVGMEIYCATSDDGKNFSQFQRYRETDTRFLNSRYLKFRISMKTGNEKGVEKTYEFVEEGHTFTLNKYSQTLNSDLLPVTSYETKIEDKEETQEGILYYKNIDKKEFKKIIALGELRMV